MRAEGGLSPQYYFTQTRLSNGSGLCSKILVFLQFFFSFFNQNMLSSVFPLPHRKLYL